MAILRIDNFGGSAAAADAVRDRVGAILRGKTAGKALGAGSARIVEFVLMSGIAVIFGLLFWTAFSPLPNPPTTPPPRAAAPAEIVTGPVNPFGEAANNGPAPPVETGPDLAETTLNLTLHGTWIDENGGTAIIGTPDGKQSRYAVGDTITSGAKLERVYRDQVVLNRSGIRESLRLINREPSIIPVAPRQSAPAAASVDIGAGLSEVSKLVVVAPEIDKVGNVKLTLAPAGDENAFEQLGFRDGDHLVAIDSVPVGQDIAGAASRLSSLAGKKTVTISVERDGVVVPIEIGAKSYAPQSEAPVRD
ncbi:MAG: type II secretion system protein N [Parvularculaceae bacterium]